MFYLWAVCVSVCACMSVVVLCAFHGLKTPDNIAYIIILNC